MAYLARQFSPAMIISNHNRYSFLYKLIVFTANKHETLCLVEMKILKSSFSSRTVPEQCPSRQQSVIEQCSERSIYTSLNNGYFNNVKIY